VNNLSVIDSFTDVFSRYIDSGFGLLHGEVAWLTGILVALDMTLAGLFWAMGGHEDVIAKLIKKTLYVGAFAFILNNFNSLSGIIFRSFAGLGLEATGSAITQAQLLQPGRLAAVGVTAAQPMMTQIGQLSGFPDVFLNLDTIAVLLLAWLVVIASFFILAVQLFVTLIEFKLTTLAGFVLVPFALWNKTAFLAERVLGNVISAGIKVLVLAVIVGIGSSIFGQFTPAAGMTPTIDTALALMLASLALFGLGIFGPGIATGLVSGAPQLGAGAAAGTLLGAGGLVVAGGAATAGAARLATGTGGTSVRAASSMVKGARSAYSESATASGASGARAMGAGLAGVGRAGAESVGNAVKNWAKRAAGGAGARTDDGGATPGWAQRLQRHQHIERGVSTVAQTLRSGEHGGSGANPSLGARPGNGNLAGPERAIEW
jgi:type IV secretion system protein TrbL